LSRHETASWTARRHGGSLPGKAIVSRAIIVLALSCALAWVPSAGAGSGAVATASSLKGSSCSHPYRVFYNLPGTYNPKSPGGPTLHMAGDTGKIPVHSPKNTSTPSENTNTFEPYPKHWSGHLCELRITFNFRKPYVSHHPPKRLVIHYPHQDYIHGIHPELKTLEETATG